MITYNDLYEALRKERYAEQLQPLSKKFVKDVAVYLEEKKAESSGDGDIFSETVTKTKKQFENAISMFKELMLRRKKKILNIVFIAAETGLSKRDSENMLPFEKTLFEEIMKSIGISDRELNQIMKGGEEEEEKAIDQLILFKEGVDEFLDFEGNKTGPYKKGEVANIGSEIAKILISGGKAEYLEEQTE